MIRAGISFVLLVFVTLPCASALGQAARQAGDAFELRVVGPDGKPVPQALVEIRTRPIPEAEQILEGTFVRKGNYGAFVATDEDGWLVAKLPASFSLSIQQPGFGPYMAAWGSGENPESIPSKFTAELDAAWSVGGVVVDTEGAAVEGATVRPNLEFKKRPGDLQQLGVGTRLTTDANGKWRFDSVPDSLADVFVEINHPDFMPVRRSLPRDGFGIGLGDEPAERIVMDRGIAVRGVVTDDSGTPLAGAVIRTQFLNDTREATTNEKGEYELRGCEPRMARIVAWAKGRAMDLQEVRVEPDMAPVNFQLLPGGTIRVRVVDEKGDPIPRTRIFFQRWRGQIDYFEFDHIEQYTDENGVWEWHEAPLDMLNADIAAPGRMQLPQQMLVAREEEYVLQPPPPLVVSGSVVDAETGEPIKSFRVIWGIRSTTDHMNWVRDRPIEGRDGQYVMRQSYGYPAHLVRIEADGYLPAVSREIESDEGDVRIDFKLEKGQNVAAVVLTPSGAPAAGAKIALGVAGSQISVENGEIDDGSTYAARLEADEAGRFSFPPQEGPFQIVVTHPTGFAHLNSADGPIAETISLTAWARLEGTFRVGAEPVANAPITLNIETVHSYGPDVPSIFTHHDVTTGPDGRFVFERAFPGEGRVGRSMLLMVDEGATEVTSSRRDTVVLAAGQTSVIELGGVGRPVMGKLAPPERHQGKVLWNFALVHVQADVPPAPDVPPDLPDAAELEREWRGALNELRAASPYFSVSVDRDGSFRVEDVPAGIYKLSVRFQQDAPGQLANYEFSVPVMESGRSDQPLDLGVLTLQ